MKSRMGRHAGALVFGAVAAVSPALAEDTVAAEALFNRGIAEMDAGHLAVACPALEESYRQDPKGGTLYALADCTQRAGKFATALAHYEDYLGLFDHMPKEQALRHRDRAEKARREILRLRPAVPTLLVALPANAPADTVVKRDGVVLGRASIGTALPADPGEHTLSTQAPGGPLHEERVAVAEGEQRRVEIVVEPPAPVVVAPAQAPQPPAVAPASHVIAPLASPVRPESVTSGSHSSDHTWAWVAGGVAVAGFGAGAVTGGLSLSSAGTVNAHCPDHVCDSTGASALHRGTTFATASDVTFGVGLAAAATAVVLLVLPTKSAEKESHAASLVPVILSDGRSAWGIGARGTW